MPGPPVILPLRLFRRCVWFALALGASAAAGADRVADLARIHLEAMGGRQRVEALKALRATGTVTSGGKRVRFTLIAARPARVRVETENGGRTLVQATDGEEPPWEFGNGSWPPRYQPMRDNVAKTFAADAEFDDPLVAGAKRGFTYEYGGEAELNGKKLLRVLVTRKRIDTFSVLLDPDTYLIVARTEQRHSTFGRVLQIVTRYEDFRPVDGVLLPHEITVSMDGRVTQQTKIEQIIANPKLTDDTFTRPKRPGETKK